MCMITVERCEVIPETRAWKVFRKSVYDGALLPSDRRLPPRVLYIVGEWNQADPIRTYTTTLSQYCTGFHSFQDERAAQAWQCGDTTDTVLPVLVRGLAYYGIQMAYSNIIHYGWTAQEMLILPE